MKRRYTPEEEDRWTRYEARVTRLLHEVREHGDSESMIVLLESVQMICARRVAYIQGFRKMRNELNWNSLLDSIKGITRLK